ncbi:hypothetical protein, partial [Escherichia coli]|uniref:hypothetical protein n=1 Tax=Escherichia coli TaxID=562 RepID=UPI003B7C45CB
LYADTLYAKVTGSTKYIFRIEPTNNSTLPPILNAVEVYRMVPTAERATDGGDGIVSNLIYLILIVFPVSLWFAVV